MAAEHYAIELVPHRAEWVETARRESARLKDALGGMLITVHHIGSTAIPGIRAKPIVDLIPLVTSVAALDGAAPRLETLGYEYLGEFGLPGRRYCRLIDPVTGKRKFQLHCFQPDAAEFPRHLAFRDYLRAHPAVAKEYEAEKIRAAALHPNNVLAYNGEKSDWIQRAQADALAWWNPR
jgi:GrpB-like predicted nucleotidyltransferase (UPF0157 family)